MAESSGPGLGKETSKGAAKRLLATYAEGGEISGATWNTLRRKRKPHGWAILWSHKQSQKDGRTLYYWENYLLVMAKVLSIRGEARNDGRLLTWKLLAQELPSRFGKQYERIRQRLETDSLEEVQEWVVNVLLNGAYEVGEVPLESSAFTCTTCGWNVELSADGDYPRAKGLPRCKECKEENKDNAVYNWS